MGSFSNKTTFKQRKRGYKEITHVDMQRKIILGTGNYTCKSPEAGVCLLRSGKSKEESAGQSGRR